MVSRRELFLRIKKLLEAAGNADFRFDAVCIIENVFGGRLPEVMLEEYADEEAADRALAMAEKRSKGYPLQYILGEWEFFGYPFLVGEGVLIPRPDTEVLVEQIIDICRSEKPEAPKIADLCSGSGCIAVALKKELPDSEITAVELSDRAIEYLRKNAELNNAAIEIIHGDVLSRECAEKLSNADIIVCNPPYLTAEDMESLQKEVGFEPEAALFGGSDGLEFYRKITSLWRNSLKNGGFLAYEFGLNQHAAVRDILESMGFENIQLRRDTAGIIRTAAGRKSEENYG